MIGEYYDLIFRKFVYGIGDVVIEIDDDLIKSIHDYYAKISDRVIKEHSLEDGEGKRVEWSARGSVPDTIFEMMIRNILNNLGLPNSRIKVGKEKLVVEGQFSDDYLSRITNTAKDFLVGSNANQSTINIDCVVRVDDYPLIVSEHKFKIDITDFRRALQDFNLVNKNCPNAQYIIFALEDNIGRSDLHEDKPYDEVCGSLAIHTTLSHFSFGVDVFVLMDGPRSGAKGSFRPEYYKFLSDYKLRRTYNRLEEIVMNRLNYYGIEYSTTIKEN